MSARVVRIINYNSIVCGHMAYGIWGVLGSVHTVCSSPPALSPPFEVFAVCRLPRLGPKPKPQCAAMPMPWEVGGRVFPGLLHTWMLCRY